ncbi:MAG: hypothetical protein ACREGE_00860 [Candidatus Microsaccharimonas sp.]
MSESEDMTAVMERSRSVLKSSVLTIDANRYGEHGQKMLRFTVVDHDISNPDHVYGIGHVIRLDPAVAKADIYSGDSDVFVTLHSNQMIDEELVVKLAKAIGNALGYVYGHVVVTIGRLE